MLCRALVLWFNKHGRSYPWRDSGDPFKVLVAEMMLRRTRADQVESAYKELFGRYPDAQSLAEGNSDEVADILYPLGLKWRTPAFQEVARAIVKDYGGKVPSKRHELLKLTGVGDYVAGAVLSIGYGKKEWIVDTNIVRVFRRYFGISTSVEGRRDKRIIELAKVYARARNPRQANLAILDFAALICGAKNPRHDVCPLKRKCRYLRTDVMKISGMAEARVVRINFKGVK